MADQLTDLQLSLLETIDRVRWQENDQLDIFQFLRLQRALGEGDGLLLFELEQAAAFVLAHPEKPPSPPMGSVRRSPWKETWLANPFIPIADRDSTTTFGEDCALRDRRTGPEQP